MIDVDLEGAASLLRLWAGLAGIAPGFCGCMDCVEKESLRSTSVALSFDFGIALRRQGSQVRILSGAPFFGHNRVLGEYRENLAKLKWKKIRDQVPVLSYQRPKQQLEN